MGNKFKLNLDSLKVESFVTSRSESEQKQLKGGAMNTFISTPCPTWYGSDCTYQCDPSGWV